MIIEEKVLPAVSYGVYDKARFFGSDEMREDDERSPFEIDRSRIIHSAAFRRLQGKTQIFGVANDDFFRTRLTHTLEVAQIAKGIALIAKTNPELVETIALAHDIGHPPFGHSGERALNDLMMDKRFGIFDSNAQNLRILAKLEFKSRKYNGLNLTRATLDGLLKHKRDVTSDGKPKNYFYPSEEKLIHWIIDTTPEKHLSFEGQIVDWADQIAYSVHDIEDGIHAQMITSMSLHNPMALQKITEALAGSFDTSSIQKAFQELTNEVRNIESIGSARERACERKSLTSRLIHSFVTGVTVKSAGNGKVRKRHAYDLEIPKELQCRSKVYQQIAMELVIHNHTVASIEQRAHNILGKLFEALTAKDALYLYTDEYRQFYSEAQTDAERGRVACDFIAAMTDHAAENFYRRLF